MLNWQQRMNLSMYCVSLGLLGHINPDFAADQECLNLGFLVSLVFAEIS